MERLKKTEKSSFPSYLASNCPLLKESNLGASILAFIQAEKVEASLTQAEVESAVVC